MSTLENILNLIRQSDHAAEMWIGASRRLDYVATDMKSVYAKWVDEWMRLEKELARFPGDWLEAAYHIRNLRQCAG